MAEKSKILIIGGTGSVGKFIVEASAKSEHPTFFFSKGKFSLQPDKGRYRRKFQKPWCYFGLLSFINLEFLIINMGDLNDHGSLVKAIKQVDVVISTVGSSQWADQSKIIDAIKEAGNVKRFFPSEFGNDVDRSNAVGPAKFAFAAKAQIRRKIEAEGIPYTYVSSNYFAGYFLTTLVQPGPFAPLPGPPPKDKLVILGDGNVKAVFNKEEDVGTFTIKAVDDPRTLNKILYVRPSKNTYTFNDLVSLWEKKIGNAVDKTYVAEEQLLRQIQDSPIPLNIISSIHHSVFVKGDQTKFEIDPSFGVEASELYPDVSYTTVDEYLEQFA